MDQTDQDGRVNQAEAQTKNTVNIVGASGTERTRSVIGCTTPRRGSRQGWSAAFGKFENGSGASAGACGGKGIRRSVRHTNENKILVHAPINAYAFSQTGLRKSGPCGAV